MSSVLGSFSIGLHGRLTTLAANTTSHAALTTGVHGAVATATANKIMLRDSNGRVDVVAPAAADSTTKVPTTAWVQNEIGLSGGGSVTSVGSGTGLTGGPITTTGSLSLANTTVTPATYTLATVTVDAQGRITSAANGSAAVTNVIGTAPVVSSGGSTPAISMAAATASVNGYMTTTFAAKLNGIAAGAQVNAVTTVHGRTGAVVSVSGDYSIQEISGVTISDTGPSGGANGDVWFEY